MLVFDLLQEKLALVYFLPQMNNMSLIDNVSNVTMCPEKGHIVTLLGANCYIWNNNKIRVSVYYIFTVPRNQSASESSERQ